MTTTTNPALAALRANVTGKVESGEAQAIIGIPAVCQDCHRQECAPNCAQVVTAATIRRGGDF